MKNLQMIAQELNQVLGLMGGEKIKIVGVSKGVLTAEIVEAAAGIEPDDVLTLATVNGLKELGVKVPKKVVKAAEAAADTDEDEDASPVPAPVPAPKAERVAKPVKESYTRIDAVCEALKTKKPKTVDAWIAAANALMEANGGQANNAETRTQIKKVQLTLRHFDTGLNIPE